MYCPELSKSEPMKSLCLINSHVLPTLRDPSHLNNKPILPVFSLVCFLQINSEKFCSFQGETSVVVMLCYVVRKQSLE